MPDNIVETQENRRVLSAFFFWASWACVIERPNQSISYTNNWPAERLVGNTPPPMLVMISNISVVLLLAGIASLASYYAFFLRAGYNDLQPIKSPTIMLTPSMKAIHKFFFVVAFMMLLQIGFGIITAHYTVEGTSIFGFPLSKWLPYTLTRTWHLQLAIFWITTALLSTALYVAPLVLGKDPRFQRLGVNYIFWASIVLVAGSMVGEYLAINHHLPLTQKTFGLDTRDMNILTWAGSGKLFYFWG
jgi:nitric oxide reductase subunit B